MIEINATKIKNGDKLEQHKLLFLTNPVGYKILSNKQGYKIKDLNDLEILYYDVLDGKKVFNFDEVMRLITISSAQIKASKTKYIPKHESKLKINKTIIQ